MTFHINSPVGSGGSFGTGSVSRITGEQGLGFFRLNMTVDFVIEPSASHGEQGGDSPQLTELVAEARIGGKSVGSFSPLSPGYLPIRTYQTRSNQQSVPLACDLDRARLEAIENVRAGGSLTFDISIQGRFSTGNAFSSGESFVINQGLWVEVLANVGYRRTLLIEVHVPDPYEQPELARAVTDLEQARRHLLTGHDRDAVGALRDALEQVTLAFGDDDTVPSDINRVLFANSRTMTKAERLRVLRRALKLVTHPARHRDQVSVAIEWNRTDATQMITMVGAFINEMSAPDARPTARTSSTEQPSPSTDKPQSEPSAEGK